MIEYYIREHFDGTYSVVQTTKKKRDNWFFRRWIVVHEQILAEGVTQKEAREAMEKQIAIEHNNGVKSITRYNDRGDLGHEHYPM